MLNVFLLINFIFFSSCIKKAGKQPVKPSLKLSAQLGGIIYLDTTPVIHIATTLFNPTEDTIRFVSMTCSYEDMFLTDTSGFKIQSRYDCFSNFPEVVLIPPHTKMDQFIMVRPVNRYVKTIDSKIRIGMYYLIPKKENGFDGIIKQYENREKATVLWSDTLDLKRLYRSLYK